MLFLSLSLFPSVALAAGGERASDGPEGSFAAGALDGDEPRIEARLLVHPDDLAAWGFVDGDWCLMSSARGSVRIKLAANRRSPPGTRNTCAMA